MKEVKQCSISRMAFTLEEDAFDTLYKYIEDIRSRCRDIEDSEEILADIEARIAELILSVHSTQEVVAKPLIDNIIAQLGSVDDICAEMPLPDEEQAADASSATSKGRRQLYRNIEDAPIGGVCSGIAAYVGCSAAVVRLVALLLVFFGGVSVIFYFILWIVIPAAVTARQKLEMRGEPITASTIKDYYNSLTDNEQRRTAIASIFSAIGRVLMVLFKALMVIILFALIMALVAVSVGLFAVIVMRHDLCNWQQLLVSVMALSSMVMLLSLGIYVALQILNSRKINFGAIITAFAIWFGLSLITAAIVTFNGESLREGIELLRSTTFFEIS